MADNNRIEKLITLEQEILAFREDLASNSNGAALAEAVNKLVDAALAVEPAKTAAQIKAIVAKSPNVLYLDFTKMVFRGDLYDPEFSVDYLHQQLNVPEPINDSYLAGSVRIINGKVCADSVRVYAMITQALTMGWIKIVPDYIWRFYLMKNTNIDDSTPDIRVYEILPGHGFGKVVIEGPKHRARIIELASKGYYVSHRLDRLSAVPSGGVRMGQHITLYTESQSRFLCSA